MKFPDGLYFTYYLTLYHLLNRKLNQDLLIFDGNIQKEKALLYL